MWFQLDGCMHCGYWSDFRGGCYAILGAKVRVRSCVEEAGLQRMRAIDGMRDILAESRADTSASKEGAKDKGVNCAAARTRRRKSDDLLPATTIHLVTIKHLFPLFIYKSGSLSFLYSLLHTNVTL